MATNINPDTGVRYGVISTRNIDQDVLDTILQNGTDLSYAEAEEEIRRDVEADVRAGKGILLDDVDMEVQSRMEHYQCEEPVVRYVLTDDAGQPTLEVQTTWLGGAQLLWVFKSPYRTKARLCSPCVPNAGDLDNLDPDGEECYDVPPDWRAGVDEVDAQLEDDAAFEAVLENDDDEPEPYVCEVVLKGFDGSTDETDGHVLWVVTSMPCEKLADWLTERGVEFESVTATEVHTEDAGVDFDLPEEEHDFMSQVKR